MKIEIGNWRFRFVFSIKRLVEVTGINSNIDESMESHILLWDFDNQTIEKVTASLSKIQDNWLLPRIHIIKTGEGRYHAYCLKRTPRSIVIAILASTPFICETFFKMGIMRGYWTLRITPKRSGEGFLPVRDLPSTFKEDTSLVSGLDTVRYKTELH